MSDLIARGGKNPVDMEHFKYVNLTLKVFLNSLYLC